MSDQQPLGSAQAWDARYGAVAGGLFGEDPNEYLRMIFARADLRAFNPRTALCLADGDGRNGTWLAQQGLTVTAVDHSDEATRRARARDEAAGVTVERITADLADWTPEVGQTWDLACILYLHGTAALRERTLRIAYESLPHDGWLLLEGFAKAQAARPDMGPDNADKLYDGAELERWLSDAEIVEATRGIVCLKEGRRHAGEAEVERLVARRRFNAGMEWDPASI